ncbi:MAG: thioredoxin [Deltaproteobacteria bacterium]
MAMVHLTDANFKDEVLSSELPVLVDFWAQWCGPCRMIAPIVEELAGEFTGKVKVGKMDVDEAPQTASRYGIMSIPTLVFFKQGKIMGQVVGALGKAELKKRIEESI